MHSFIHWMWLVSFQPPPWDPQDSWLFLIPFISFFSLHIFFLYSWPRSTVTRFPLYDPSNRPRLRQKPYAIERNHYSTSPSLFPFIWELGFGFCLVHFGPIVRCLFRPVRCISMGNKISSFSSSSFSGPFRSNTAAATQYAMNSRFMMSAAAAAVLGLLSHLLYFIRGEHHKNAILMCKLAVAVPTVAWMAMVYGVGCDVVDGGQRVAVMAAAYLGALWTSMIVYRCCFHRLHAFPGPPLAKTSKFYHFFCLGKLNNFRRLHGWHQQFGAFVRIGESALLASHWRIDGLLSPSTDSYQCFTRRIICSSSCFQSYFTCSCSCSWAWACAYGWSLPRLDYVSLCHLGLSFIYLITCFHIWTDFVLSLSFSRDGAWYKGRTLPSFG